jgi:hypothetical protein
VNTQAHTRYKTKSGELVPSVTTILSLLNKPALVKWANNLGLQGIDVTKYVDILADAGSLAHDMILDYFRGIITDTSECSQDVIKKAENAFLSFLEWAKQRKLEPVLVEHEMVSETKKYGGKCDWYGYEDGIKTLLDFKTGSGIYEEHAIQLAAYKYELEEEGHEVEIAKIIRIPRTEDEIFEIKAWKNLSKQAEIFFHLRDIYELKRQTKER